MSKLQGPLDVKDIQIAQLKSALDGIYSSRSWRLTRPLRVTKILFQQFLNLLFGVNFLVKASIIKSMSKECTLLDVNTIWPSCNPSLLYSDSETYCVIRTVNYRLDSHDRYKFFGDRPNTNSYIKLIGGAATQNNEILINDKKIRKSSIFAHDGIEDIRIFAWNGVAFAIGSALNNQPVCINTMVLMELNLEDGSINRWKFIHSPVGSLREKNWMVMPREDGLYIAHTLHPLRLFKLNLDFDVDESLLELAVKMDGAEQLKGLRGSSGFVPYKNGHLGIAHYKFGIARRHFYPHVFVWISDDLTCTKISRPFFMKKRTIEFVSGLQINRNGDLLVGWGYRDCKAYLSVFGSEITKKLGLEV